MVRTLKRAPRPPKESPQFKLFATTAAGLENVLQDELRKIGARHPSVQVRGVSFEGDWETVFRVNLWSRTAHRVLIELAEFNARDRKALYEGVRSILWDAHVSKHGTLAVDSVSSGPDLTHTRFVAQVIKDAIVDGFRDRTGVRPDVDANDPDLRGNLL